jgi:DNA polymerase-3 subunit delta'
VAGYLTRGQPAAIRQVTAMIAAGMPHALLLVGPRSVGKTTLALDIAAALLCLAPDPADRPCRACRGCRLVADGNHPDLHRVAPDGAGLQIRIAPVGALIRDLTLLPVEGGMRVAVLESAHRLNEDAQNVFLKFLEEPPAGVTIILCADDEDRLLPTIHSRVARVRLGTVGAREIEALLEERGDADAPTANGLARIAGGRPGLAVAYARAADAARIRGEVTRSLLDLVGTSRALRLVRVRELLARVKQLRAALVATETAAAEEAPRGRRRGRTAPPTAPAVQDAATDGSVEAVIDADPGVAAGDTAGAAPVRASAQERRSDAALLLDLWRDLALDLARVALGDRSTVHDPELLEELIAVAARLPDGGIGAFLVRLDAAGQALETNVSPELIADVLALAWPRPVQAA